MPVLLFYHYWLGLGVSSIKSMTYGSVPVQVSKFPVPQYGIGKLLRSCKDEETKTKFKGAFIN